MTNKQHPITPPPELAQTLWNEMRNAHTEDILASYAWDRAIAKAYRAGADQELEDCCEWLDSATDARDLRIARRPKPPSLKEQALESLTKIEDNKATYLDSSIIRRALEALPND